MEILEFMGCGGPENIQVNATRRHASTVKRRKIGSAETDPRHTVREQVRSVADRQFQMPVRDAPDAPPVTS